jgi:NAD(P)-dependent dehydrogenase (short-subunit alcohol dehydrogenase family)
MGRGLVSGANGSASAGSPFSLAGRVALVTGASSGLGRGCAIELGRAGAQLLCVARRQEALDELVEELAGEGIAAEAFAADLLDDEAVAAAVQRATELGDLGAVINAAGITGVGEASTYPLDEWDALFATNVRAVFSVCRSAGAAMLASESQGAMVNFSSILGTIAVPGAAAYIAAKHAIEGLTKALAVEWGPSGIRVNAVAPAFVETPLVEDYLSNPEYREQVVTRTPAARLIEVEEVARAVTYLATEASAGVTGHILRIDGGWTAC